MARLLANAQAELALLQGRVRQLETQHGLFKPKESAKVSNSSESDLLFPPEVFLLIGKQLRPGSRSLLKLASASKELFALLQPHLLSYVEPSWVNQESFQMFMKEKGYLLSKYVRRLAWYPFEPRESSEHRSTLALTAELLRLCRKSLQTLILFQPEHLPLSYIRRLVFPNVRYLHLPYGISLPHWLPRAFPNVEEFVHTYHHWPQEAPVNTGLWRAMEEHWSQLKSISMTFGNAPPWDSFPRLVAKISDISMWNWDVDPALFRWSCFAPRNIRFGVQAHNPAKADELWRLFTSLGSLKDLDATFFSTENIFRHGFPPNIERCRLESVVPSFLNGEQMQSIRTRIPNSLKDSSMDVMLSAFDDPTLNLADPTIRHTLVDELVFWESLNKPRYWMKIDHEVDQGGGQRVRADYVKLVEHELWTRSIRPGE